MQKTFLTGLAEMMYRLMMASKMGGNLFDYFVDSGIEEYDLYLEEEVISFIPAILNRIRKLPNTIYYSANETKTIKTETSGKTSVQIKPFFEMKRDGDSKTLITCCPWNYELQMFFKKMNYHTIAMVTLIDYSLYKRTILEQCKNHLESKNVSCLFTKFPQANLIENPSALEKYFGSHSVYGYVVESKKYGLDASEIVFGTEPKALRKNGVWVCADRKSEQCNYVGGFRLTTDMVAHSNKKIWIFGSSVVVGYGADDAHTIASSLQRELNIYFGEKNPYSVVTASNYTGHSVEYVLEYVQNLPIQAGDICIFHMDYPMILLEQYKEIINLNHDFKRPHNYGEIFFDINHMVGRGYCAQGKVLFEHLKNQGYFDKKAEEQKITKQVHIKNELKNDMLSEKEEKELQLYLDSLTPYRRKVGSIVMNCNPFTLGHRYLIEESAKKVDELYIFVVQEDKSFFKFADRLELVKKGTEDIANVKVVPSGQFIISTRTFEAYSNKANLQEQVIDASLDVEIFAKKIAPALGITIRFAGEEPLDNVTKQYNDTMSRILPQYGIEFEVIERKTMKDEVISASRVRKYLEMGDFDSIAECVPKTTYEYLVKNYAKQEK